MSAFIEAFLLTVLLGIIVTVTGRILATALNVRLLKRPGQESWVASAFLGTGFLTLVFGMASFAGCPAQQGLLVAGLVVFGLVGYLGARGRLGQAFLRPQWTLGGGILVVALGAEVIFTLLLLAMNCSRIVYGDNALYYGPAEWLQTHGFGTTAPVENPSQPIVWLIQSYHAVYRSMGPKFLLAMVRAAIPCRIAAELYPVVMAWGTALNMGAVYLLARWGLRTSRFYAAVGTATVTLACTTLTYSATIGFFAQVYGTAMLGFGLALLSRLLAPSNWTTGNATLLGLALAAQVSMYNQLFPFLALAALATLVYGGWRNRRRGLGRLVRFAGLVLLSATAFGNWEFWRAAPSILFHVGVDGCGWPLNWQLTHFTRFLLGFYSHPGFIKITTSAAEHNWFVGSLVGALCLLGLWRATRFRPGLPLAVAALVFVGLGVYFRFWRHDPWTGEAGHTWNLFKLSKFGFPLVAGFQIAGLAFLLERMNRGRWLAMLVCLAVVVYALPLQFHFNRRIVRDMRHHFGENCRPADLRHLCQRIDDWEPRRLYIVSEPLPSWDRWFPALLLCPRAFANSWQGSPGMFETPGSGQDLPEAFEAGTVFLQYGRPPFSQPLEHLPFGYSVIDGTHPLIFRLKNPNQPKPDLVEGPPGDKTAWTWIGTEPVQIFVLSPRKCRAELSLAVTPGPSWPEKAECSLCLSDATGTSRVIKVEAGAEKTITFPVWLTTGVNQLGLRSLDPTTRVEPADPRVQVLKAAGMSIASETNQEYPPTFLSSN